jgi:hypothetical protein
VRKTASSSDTPREQQPSKKKIAIDASTFFSFSLYLSTLTGVIPLLSLTSCKNIQPYSKKKKLKRQQTNKHKDKMKEKKKRKLFGTYKNTSKLRNLAAVTMVYHPFAGSINSTSGVFSKYSSSFSKGL